MSERSKLYAVAFGCALFWLGVAIENITDQPLLVLLGVYAP